MFIKQYLNKYVTSIIIKRMYKNKIKSELLKVFNEDSMAFNL